MKTTVSFLETEGLKLMTHLTRVHSDIASESQFACTQADLTTYASGVLTSSVSPFGAIMSMKLGITLVDALI